MELKKERALTSWSWDTTAAHHEPVQIANFFASGLVPVHHHLDILINTTSWWMKKNNMFTSKGFCKVQQTDWTFSVKNRGSKLLPWDPFTSTRLSGVYLRQRSSINRSNKPWPATGSARLANTNHHNFPDFVPISRLLRAEKKGNYLTHRITSDNPISYALFRFSLHKQRSNQLLNLSSPFLTAAKPSGIE